MLCGLMEMRKMCWKVTNEEMANFSKGVRGSFRKCSIVASVLKSSQAFEGTEYSTESIFREFLGM